MDTFKKKLQTNFFKEAYDLSSMEIKDNYRC